jgi:hypothetical protein
MGAYTIFNCSSRLGRVQSDVTYMQRSLKEGLIPKGFHLHWTPQGLDCETGKKVGKLLADCSLKVMGVVLDGMRRKEEYLVDRIMWEINKGGEEEEEGERDCWKIKK